MSDPIIPTVSNITNAELKDIAKYECYANGYTFALADIYTQGLDGFTLATYSTGRARIERLLNARKRKFKIVWATDRSENVVFISIAPLQGGRDHRKIIINGN